MGSAVGPSSDIKKLIGDSQVQSFLVVSRDAPFSLEPHVSPHPPLLHPPPLAPPPPSKSKLSSMTSLATSIPAPGATITTFAALNSASNSSGVFVLALVLASSATAERLDEVSSVSNFCLFASRSSLSSSFLGSIDGRGLYPSDL